MNFGTDYTKPEAKECSVCGKDVQLADRMVVERETIHKGCFTCRFCDAPLKVGACSMELSFYGRYGPCWFCNSAPRLCAHLPNGEKEAKMKAKGVKEKAKGKKK